jgi:hypothetical protein
MQEKGNKMKKLMLFIIGLSLIGCGTTEIIVRKTVIVTNTKIKNLKCDGYDLSGLSLSSVPDFSTMQSRKAISTNVDMLDIPETNNLAQFSKFDGTTMLNVTENFGLQCVGHIFIPTTGSYLFKTISDDGSNFYVDGTKVVNNDGNHGMTAKSGTMNLSYGVHEVKLDYYQGDGNKGLMLMWKVPGGVETMIVSGAFVE